MPINARFLLFVTAAVAALLSLLLVGLVRRVALRHRILDFPNERSLHNQPIPRGGGVAIVVLSLAGILLCWGFVPSWAARSLLSFICAGLLVAVVSWRNDVKPLTNVVRLGAHVLASLVVLVGVGSWAVLETPVLGLFRLGSLALPMTVLWMVGLTNAYNFMDGIDGMAGTQAVVAGIGWVALAGSAERIETWLGLLLAGSSLGFLAYNWPPAKIFMGDVGSAFLGFSFAVLAILGAQHDPRLALAGILTVWPFVFDTSFTFVRRLRKGENVFKAHRSHLYQRLVLVGYSHRFVTCLYGALGVVGVALALIWEQRLAAASWLVPSALASAVVGLWLFVVWAERHQRASSLVGPDGRKSPSAQ
jgi:UDP-N-acetylmuramyl pentapeptide phosphotransferase/UDP-N-acetylglucosamine-1-phosphate transferase